MGIGDAAVQHATDPNTLFDIAIGGISAQASGQLFQFVPKRGQAGGATTPGIRTPQQAQGDLEAVFGEDRVTSSALPAKPHQASATRDDVILGDDGSRAVQVRLDDGTIQNIPYDQHGLAIFDDFVCRAATKALCSSIMAPISAKKI